jgi:hypothetical protein
VPNPAVFLPVSQVSTPESGGTGRHDGREQAACLQNRRTWRRFARRSVSDDGLIAKDTVIFYNRKPSPPREAKLPPPPAPGVKRYSDVN